MLLVDELLELLKNMEPDVATIKAYWGNSGLEQRFQELEEQSHQEDFWKHPNLAEISKELSGIKQQREKYQHITDTFAEIPELIELFAPLRYEPGGSTQDDRALKELKENVNKLAKEIASFKVNLLLGEPEDKSNCFLSINSGAGGTESQDWAHMLLRMYIRFCEREKFSVSIIDYQAADEAGIKSATLFIKGKNAYGILKCERGIHRLVRISPFDANKRRHTSFAAVMITPEMPEVEITIDPKDLRIDTYRASGAGGQHVNKTDSAVRITHMPTNTVVQCQNERSQTQNKETAMKMLKAKLVQKQKEEERAKEKKVEKKKIEWGSQIRSYVLHPYKMVKDHRTSTESPQPDLVLDGDLMDFIENYLIWSAK
ncbi:peptide chain release factor 2 [Candidatus Dependentiae bacterium]